MLVAVLHPLSLWKFTDVITSLRLLPQLCMEMEVLHTLKVGMFIEVAMTVV